MRIILVRHGQTEWNQGSGSGEHFNRFDYDGKTFTVLTLNEVCHLLSRPKDLDESPNR